MNYPFKRLSSKEAIAQAEYHIARLRKMTLPPTNWNMDLEKWRAL